jgi:hypothetical protein
MNLPFLGHRHKKAAALPADPEGVAALLSECELLRAQAARAGVRLDDTPASLEALDQIVPRWRDDAELLPWLGNDAGLYLGTVVVRTVPGAAWVIRADGEPVVRLASGREVEVVGAGQEWAASGVPELSQLYGEIAET